MTNEQWNLLFAGASAICAVWGTIMSIIASSNKEDTEKIKKQVEAYRVEIIKKSDLLMLVPISDEIKKVSTTFAKITTNDIPRKGDIKTELDYYGQIKNKTGDILNEIPEEYKEIRDILDDIKSALGYCITEKKKFSELGRNNKYSYYYVDDKFTKVIGKLNTLTRDIKYK